jgi:hypothetical protein
MPSSRPDEGTCSTLHNVHYRQLAGTSCNPMPPGRHTDPGHLRTRLREVLSTPRRSDNTSAIGPGSPTRQAPAPPDTRFLLLSDRLDVLRLLVDGCYEPGQEQAPFQPRLCMASGSLQRLLTQFAISETAIVRRYAEPGDCPLILTGKERSARSWRG